MGVFDIENKLNKEIDIPYVLSKGFSWGYGEVPLEETHNCGTVARRLHKYVDDIDAIIKYYPICKQLHINDIHCIFAKYIPIKTEYEFDIAYEELIKFYKTHDTSCHYSI